MQGSARWFSTIWELSAIIFFHKIWNTASKTHGPWRRKGTKIKILDIPIGKYNSLDIQAVDVTSPSPQGINSSGRLRFQEFPEPGHSPIAPLNSICRNTYPCSKCYWKPLTHLIFIVLGKVLEEKKKKKRQISFRILFKNILFCLSTGWFF